jgi:hypothetical protein
MNTSSDRGRSSSERTIDMLKTGSATEKQQSYDVTVSSQPISTVEQRDKKRPLANIRPMSSFIQL